MVAPSPRIPTVDRLRNDIGNTGEQMAFPDAAAAPLGTDAEAGGNPPGPQEAVPEIASNRAVERRVSVPGIAIYLVTAGAVAASILLAVATAA